MKKMNKKGFTIVELVIVIAVIAILAAVLIPTFTTVIKKANKSKDTQLVRNLNTVLATDVNVNGKAHNTMQDAMDAAEAAGYNIRKINASATGNEILWDSENDLFCYYDAEKNLVSYIPEFTPATAAKRANLWVIRDKVHAEFATYYTGNETSVTTSQSFDAGIGAKLTEIEYVNTTGAEKSVIIRTVREDTLLEINAPLDTVNHYGPGALVDIKAVASASYHEFGSFEKAKIAAGRIVVEEAGSIPAVEITSATNTIKVETAKDITVSVNVEGAPATLSNVAVNVTNVNAKVAVDTAVKSAVTGAATANMVDITKVSDLADLQAKVQDASVKYILLTNDITVDSLINVTVSTTLDGNGYTLTGAGLRGSKNTTVAINNGQSAVKTDVVIKNLTIVNNGTSGACRAIETRGSLNSLTLDNVDLKVEESSDYREIFVVGGSQADAVKLTITNSNISSGESKGYAIMTFNPVEMTITNTEITSWASLYFKGADGSTGSVGSTVTATNCTFNNKNAYSGTSNAFGSIVFEDKNISFSAESCTFDVEQLGDATQSVILFSTYWGNVENCSVSLKNIQINGTINNENVEQKLSNMLKIVSGSSVKDPNNYLDEGSEVVKQGGLYIITQKD